MSGSASARAAMQFRMSPGGHDPQLLAEAAAAPSVVGHGHDRGDVGRVRLQAAEQGGQAGAAAEGHDPRAPGQVSLGVEHLHHRVTARDER